MEAGDGLDGIDQGIPGKFRWYRHRGDSDGHAEFREAPDVMSGQAFSVQVEVAAPEVSVGHAVSEDIRYSDQMDWPTATMAFLSVGAWRFGDRTRDSCCGPGRHRALDQRRAQPPIPFARFARLPLAGTLVIVGVSLRACAPQ